MVFSRFESTRDSCLQEDCSRPATRRSGIALMVVMVVFIVLYMMVYHLSFYTIMEGKIARVRHGDLQGQDALYSVAQLVMAQLTEDLVQDITGGNEEQAAGSAPAPGGEGGRGASRGGGGGEAGRFVALQAGQQGGAGAAGTPSYYDYLLEAIFNQQQHEIGDVKVKATIIDNERCFDLNRLFDYAPLPPEEDVLSGPGGDLSADDLADIAADSTGNQEQDEKNLTARIRSRVGLLNRDDDQEGGEEAGDELENVAGLEEESELNEFVEPTEFQQEATRQMLARAIEVIVSMNEDWGFLYAYEGGTGSYDSERIAGDIVEYVLARRTSPEQNRIYHINELLNIPSITRELYYGPQLVDLPEEGLETDTGFLLQEDEFGDVSSTFIYSDEMQMERDEQSSYISEQMELMQESYGSALPLGLLSQQASQFAGTFGALQANPLTSGMTGPAQVFDDEGNEYIEQPQKPIGLKEIFTSFSSGKINLNTAPVAVLYALLPSLTEGNDEEAESVALGINDYRYEFQDWEEEEGVDTEEVGAAPVKNLGQPRRPLPPEDEEFTEGFDLESMVGLDQSGAADSGAALADVDTNYFTSLEQIELVDGTEGDVDDLLTSDAGIDRVDAEDDPLLQRVLNDYRKVMCFAGTYFTIELKAKSKGSPLVKSGILIIKRDAQNKLMEVILWKELQD